MTTQTSRTAWRSAAALSVCLAACFAAAAFGGLFSSAATGPWYRALRKPAFTPPGWVFGPVWTVLYAAMAVAAWLVWRQRGRPGVRGALTWFGVQLALNAAWSPLFFGLRRPDLGFAVIVLLWAAIAVTAWKFLRISKPAGVLLLPYLLWVSFASVLNGFLWRLNAGA